MLHLGPDASADLRKIFLHERQACACIPVTETTVNGDLIVGRHHASFEKCCALQAFSAMTFTEKPAYAAAGVLDVHTYWYTSCKTELGVLR